jgi:hypothetical protein
MKTLQFIHTFAEDPAFGVLDVDIDASSGEVVRINIEAGSKIWISANKAGWLHLARICAELGTRNLESGYHFHQNYEFSGGGNPAGPEISFEVNNDLA